MLDLTKQIQLPDELRKKYTIARVLLYLIFLMATVFLAYRILFPIIGLNFSFNNPNSTKNTLVNPRSSQTGEFPEKRTLGNGETLLFNANPFGQFSNSKFTLTLDKKSAIISGAPVKIRKSWQAFFYPTGNKIGFKDGTLLTTPDGAYYIVSNGTTRKFSNTDIILQMGYPKSAFLEISNSELEANKTGIEITDASTYPDDTIFAIGDTYYKLQDRQLFPFISTQAFLSQYNIIQAVAKSSEFLTQNPVSEEMLGFADGTLGSSADSVFILSENKSYPVADAETFNKMGLNWDDVIPLSQDELSVYEKQKQFTVNEPHPNGTVFFDQKTVTYFLINNGFKLPFYNESALKTYSQRSPVLADLEGASKELSCNLEKAVLNSKKYTCQIPLESLADLIGNDYQIAVQFPVSVTVTSINTTFSTPLTLENLKNSLSKIKNALKNR